MLKKAKTLLYSTLTTLLGDSEDLVTLPVLNGPARGLKLKVRLSAGEGAMVWGSYEKEITRAMAKVCQPNWVIWDCGTHIGYFTAILAKQTGSKGKVIGFEPDLVNFKRTKHNLSINRFDNSEVVNVALGGPVGRVAFINSGDQTSHLQGTYVGGIEEGKASRDNVNASDETVVHVECISPNQAVEERHLPAPDFIKMDLEGAEAEALKHIDKIIEASHPVMLVELHNPECDEAILKFGKDYNYQLSCVLTGRPVTDFPVPSHVLCTPQSK